MKCLLHCIFRQEARGIPPGVSKQLFVVEEDELAAAVSPWPEEEPLMEVSRLLAYENSIACFHASRTVIPLRFGCVVDGESEVLRLMREHRVEYDELLDRLEGQAEMGLRLWWRPGTEESVPSTAGARYLAALRRRHGGLVPPEQCLAARFAEHLNGLYSERRNEATPAAGGRLLSLYFLVPKASLADFRATIREIALHPDMKLLVSGPWPPYNFTRRARQ